jgi:glycosyltransferase involved in cell wall biosynthesis
MKAITVFTPTYNRAYILSRLYNSLCDQTNSDFEWLVIDDGSSDTTADLVNTFIAEKKIKITYHYQENKGMVGAHNTAHHLMTTPLCVCIDSDDYMPKDAIDKILTFWEQHGSPEYAGIVGLDAFTDGTLVAALPQIKDCKFSELYVNHKLAGDVKFVHNRAIFNQYLPYTFFEGEKYSVTSYLYLFIEQKHKLLICNEVFCIVEYLPDGLTMNLFKQYKQSPKSYAHYRLAKMKFALNYRERFRNAIHYVSSSLFAKDHNLFAKTNNKVTVLLAFPLGIALYFYIQFSAKKSIRK